MTPDAKIYVAGHRGLAGSAIVRELQRQGFSSLVWRLIYTALVYNYACLDCFAYGRHEFHLCAEH